ncbi:MAG: sulfite oxidase [Pseudolabrys sp.]
MIRPILTPVNGWENIRPHQSKFEHEFFSKMRDDPAVNEGNPSILRVEDSSRKPRRTLKYPGKSRDLILLGDKPLVAETPESLLDDDTTPTELLFIRNNGRIPERTHDPYKWTLRVDGEVENELSLTLAELKSKYETLTRRMVIECGGNGRSFFDPPVRGNRWTHGGVACPQWTGVRLADVLKTARLKPSAVFSGHYGSDPAIADTSKPALSRGVPVAKLLDENNLLVWAVNGEPLPLEHGFPLRLIIPGWPGAVSAKWLTRIWIRDRRHDGPGMTGISYKIPIRPMPPPTGGAKYDQTNLEDLESMPVRAIITRPADGARVAAGKVELRGASWAGDFTVNYVVVSTDRGKTWQAAELLPPNNSYDWQRWTASVNTPSTGHMEIWAKATDSRGISQPIEAENWNPHGVGGNPVHRIAVTIDT